MKAWPERRLRGWPSIGKIKLAHRSIAASTSAAIGFDGERIEITKKSVSETINEKAPPWKPCGKSMSNNSNPKFISKLEMIATLQASAVARFQLKPIATVGTIAAANVAHPNAPRIATSLPV